LRGDETAAKAALWKFPLTGKLHASDELIDVVMLFKTVIHPLLNNGLGTEAALDFAKPDRWQKGGQENE
jgi:hypothetical protein